MIARPGRQSVSAFGTAHLPLTGPRSLPRCSLIEGPCVEELMAKPKGGKVVHFYLILMISAHIRAEIMRTRPDPIPRDHTCILLYLPGVSAT